MELELIADYGCVIGEGPLWHPAERRLYWTDIANGRLFRYDPASGAHEQCYAGDPVGGFTIQHDGALLLFMERGAIKLWRDGALTTVVSQIDDELDSRFNDVVADPAGRVFCGTMPAGGRLGRLYRLETDGSLVRLLEGIDVSNGLGFSPDRRKLYYSVSEACAVYVFDYDAASGAISNQQVLVDTAGEEGVPDGLTVDAEGYIWLARWNGNCLVRYAPDGREERRVSFPVRKVSSVTFAGPDYTDMYVTTAGGDRKAEDGALAGGLFRLRPGVRGVPEFLSRIQGSATK
jgi:D-xylonolactonase